MSDFNIEKELTKLPTSPGVYLMHKADGEVIYVGKAKNLKNRVKQYFSSSYKKTTKIEQMVMNIDYFEYIVVDNELESLILESNLIKEYRPRYNTLLKDDKNYPYIKLTVDEDYPRVFMVHRKSKDKALYFGPYMSGGIVKEALDYIKENYKLRLCKMDLSKPKKSATKTCLYYHLDMCSAPCVNRDKSEYWKEVNEIKDFLGGNIKDIVKELEKKMTECSAEERYEEAALYRDKISIINEITEKQKIDSREEFDKDIIGMYRDRGIAVIQIFEVRDGNIIDRNSNILNIDDSDTDSEIISSFIKQYYNETFFLPREIWIPCDIEEKELFDEWLSRDKIKCKIVVPKRGEKDKLVKLASLNAKIQYDQRVAKYIREEKELQVAYDDLKKMTGLDSITRLESFDISNTSGVLNVASMVVWEGKGFKKNDYRKFRLRTVDGPDDYASMREVLVRRIERFVKDDIKFNNLPSIFLIDGGRGQVHVAIDVLKEYNLDVPVMGMVKDDDHNTRGLVYNDIEIDLRDYKELFKLITKIQDETHRFAIEYHRSLRSKEMVAHDVEKKRRKKEKNV
ncbi:MAG: excinuclease ABC subunit UvrC [Lachnospiraceae bacterium]|nr:excinuclease ABC subunit UvrC [Lachnospiraceae bacterium]